jgi:hypothetical protein
MINSYEEFKTAVFSALQDKVAERISQEREYISNDLLRGEISSAEANETQSNAKDN